VQEFIVAKEESVYKMITGMQKLGWNSNLQLISSSGKKWGRRTSDEKFVSTKPRGAEARSGARIGEQIFRVSDHHVLKKHTHNEAAL
jgi:hypothetical protein